MKPGRFTLYGWSYRTLMRLAHRFNWHHTRTSYPDGDTYVRCDWCGLGMVMQRRDYKPAISTSAGSLLKEAAVATASTDKIPRRPNKPMSMGEYVREKK